MTSWPTPWSWGPLRSPTIFLPPGLEQRLAHSFPSAKPEVLLTLLKYYVMNKQEDSPWVVLPVANFDAYFGTTAFSKKWLAKIPAGFMERQNQHFGVCRYRVRGGMGGGGKNAVVILCI